MGDEGENGDGVSGSQYDKAGTGAVLSIEATGEVNVDVVSGKGKVARRGVGGRGACQEGGKMVSETEAERTRIVDDVSCEVSIAGKFRSSRVVRCCVVLRMPLADCLHILSDHTSSLKYGIKTAHTH